MKMTAIVYQLSSQATTTTTITHVGLKVILVRLAVNGAKYEAQGNDPRCPQLSPHLPGLLLTIGDWQIGDSVALRRRGGEGNRIINLISGVGEAQLRGFSGKF